MDVFSSQSATSSSLSNVSAPLGNASGKLGSQDVQVSSSSSPSSLGAAAEELSLFSSERVEKKTTAERKTSTSKRPRVLKMAQALDYLKKSGAKPTPEQLKQLAQRLLRQDPQAKRELREKFPSPSQHYAALQCALQEGEAANAPEAVLDSLRDQLSDLESGSQGRRLSADLNTINAAADFATGGAEEVAAFQETYVDAVLASDNLHTMAAHLLDRFGETDIVSGIECLLKALGQDMTSLTPSDDAVRLHCLLQDVKHLEILGTLLESCNLLSDQLSSDHSVSELGTTELMQDIVSISSEQLIYSSRLDDLADHHGAKELSAKICFLKGVDNMLSQLPLPFFPSVEARDRILEVSLEAMSTAALEEDQQA